MPCTVFIPRPLKLPEVKVEGRIAGIAKTWTAQGEEPKLIVELSRRVTLANGLFISHMVADVESVEPRTDSDRWEGLPICSGASNRRLNWSNGPSDGNSMNLKVLLILEAAVEIKDRIGWSPCKGQVGDLIVVDLL